MSLLLCFAGEIGSGKSSVSAAVAEALGWRRTGFGEYLRSDVARLGGDPNDRATLQDLGQRRVEENPLAFCHDVLSAACFEPGENRIIDGIRHIRIFEILSEVSKPTEARLLFLVAGDSTRLERVGARGEAEDFTRASQHRVEVELRELLPDRADGIVDADQPLERVVSNCLDLVRRWVTIERH